VDSSSGGKTPAQYAANGRHFSPGKREVICLLKQTCAKTLDILGIS
jgi:hypothetical protein